MRSTSNASLDAVASAFEPILQRAGTAASDLGAQMFVVVDALDVSGPLRRALTDPARPAEAKAALVAEMLGGRVDERVVEVVSGLARARWSSDGDLTEALERLAADAVLAGSQADGRLQQVEDELFRLDRLLVGQRELRRALTDRSVAAEQRVALVRGVLEGKVAPATQQLVERAAFAPRGRTMAVMLGMLGRLTARRRNRLVAVVDAAAPLTEAQVRRLTGILERAYGRKVQLNISVDSELVGGLRVQIGSEVVDATVLSRLDDARRRLAG